MSMPQLGTSKAWYRWHKSHGQFYSCNSCAHLPMTAAGIHGFWARLDAQRGRTETMWFWRDTGLGPYESGHNIVPTNICLTFSCIVSAFKCLIWLLTHWQGDHCHCTITPAEYVLCLRYTEDSPAWRQQTHLVLYLEAIWWAKLTTKKPPNREKVALNGSSLPLIGNLKQEGRKSPYSSAAATDSSHHFIHVCRRPVRS